MTELIRATDLKTVRNVYLAVISGTENMDRHARWVWGLHPSDAQLQAYIGRGEMYLFTDRGRIVAAVAVTMYQDKDYEAVPWSVSLRNDEVAALHLLAVLPEAQGRSVGKALVRAAVALAGRHGKKAVRLDTLASNLPAQHMYESLGFSRRGVQRLYAENTGWTDFLYYEYPIAENS